MRGLLAPLIKLIVFLIVTAFATYVLGATIANTSYGSTTSYKAIFTDVAGLSVGDDVRIAGVRVGSVSGIKIVDHDLAQISFSVIKSRTLPKSSQAHLRYRNLVGQRYLDIEQGAGDANDLLTKGGTIPQSQTSNAVDLTALFNGFQPLFQGLNATQINSLSTEIIQVLQGEGGSLELLLTTLADLTNAIADKDQVIGSVIDNLSSVLTAVGNRDTELSNLIVQLQGFISGLSSDRFTIGNSIDSIYNLATSTAGLLGQIRAPLAKDVTDLTALTANLNKNSATVQNFLQQLPGTVAALIRTGSYGSWFNFYLCSISADVKLPTGGVLPVPIAQPRSTVQRCQG
ncbi:MAG: Phospholipid/cholesterol/gamma-HCH transport system substrate-binding protein [Pseudonocardiales bacterium]|nr:Phospholipid/cholesterol/gamma-HCH transport system substrate-binding protein [Pseudonocardiales bacterium]